MKSDRPDAARGSDVMRRRLLLGLGAGLGLSGCAAESMQLLGTSMRGLTGADAERYPLSAEQIAAIPYASLGIRFGRSAGAIAILARIEGERETWVSADRIVLVTERGRLVKTIGLPRDLSETRSLGSDPLALAIDGSPGAAQSRIARTVDLRRDDDFGITVASGCDRLGDDDVTILGVNRKLLHIREQVTVRKWRWSTVQHFWVDPMSGRVLRSRQQFCPEVPPMQLELLRPPVRSAT